MKTKRDVVKASIFAVLTFCFNFYILKPVKEQNYEMFSNFTT